MISGAIEIIYGVDAGLVHPLLLPASQGPEKFGYIVIAYEDSPEVFDILFLRGDHVEEYAGLHHDLRTVLSEKSVRMGLSSCAMRCRVYLFSVSRQGFDRFLRTFHCAQSVNVVIDRLSRKQLASLLAGTGCRNGILEIDRPSRPFPLITLSRFHSEEELLHEASRYRQGRMIVYDLELNAMIRQRVELMIGCPSAEDGGREEEGPARKANSSAGEKSPESEPGEGCASGTDDPPVPSRSDENDGSELVAAFAKALADFRNAVAGLYREKLDRRLNNVLGGVFPSPGEFDPSLITPENAAGVLKVIEECVKRAWLYNRKKLRTRGREIVKDLYDNNHGLLLKHGLDGKVQECYQRLGE